MVNKVYQADESPIIWGETGVYDHNITIDDGMTDAVGRQGEVHDFTANARAREYVWRAWIQSGGSAPTLGAAIEIYAKTTTDITGQHDNRDSTGDQFVTNSDYLRNLKLIGLIIIDAASTNTEFVGSNTVWLPHRYFQPVFWNASGQVLNAAIGSHRFILTAVPTEVQ